MQARPLLRPLLLFHLRNKIHFRGLIITDSLVMEGALKNAGGSLSQAAIDALQAGADLLIIGGKRNASLQEVLDLHQALVQAVLSGALPLSRIDDACQRNLFYKNKYLRPRTCQANREKRSSPASQQAESSPIKN